MTWGATSPNQVRADLQLRVNQRMDAAMCAAVDIVRVPVVLI